MGIYLPQSKHLPGTLWYIVYAVLVQLLMLQQWWLVVLAFIQLEIRQVALLVLKDTSVLLKLLIMCEFFNH